AELRPPPAGLPGHAPVRPGGLAAGPGGPAGIGEPSWQGDADDRSARGEVMTITSRNPHDPADVIGEWQPAGEAELAAVVDRAAGVTGLVTPWNFPVAIPLWKAAPSLAFGNATVLKPSEESPAVALALADILAAHLPAGVFQVVLGAGETGRALTGHPGVAAVSFTGSVPAGRDVVARAAGRGARVQAEMG